jgi:hypothetical protein
MEPVFVTENHAIWAPVGPESFPLERQLDKLLSTQDCVYYPEEEWITHNMRPPDNYPLVAAWRDVVARVFIFLLEKSSSRKSGSSQYLVLVAGVAERVKQVGRTITSIKGNLDKEQRSELEGQRVERRLDTETRRKPAVKFSVAIGIFTAVVNALSLYLKRVDPPHFVNEELQTTYLSIVAAVHIASVLLLLLIVLLAIAYVVKFGIMMMRSG